MNILIVDDDRVALRMLGHQLQSLGYDVAGAQDGHEAWEEFQKRDYSIVISDWIMPGMDGLELLRRVRSSDQARYVYCILLTVKGQLADLVRGMEAGADDFLTKPFDPNELRVRLAAGRRIVELERRLSNANARMKRELESAARIQRSLLPANLPESLHSQFAWEYKPCDELGGDILNVIPLSEHEVALYLLDVAGHGLSAALQSVALSRLLTTAANASSIIRDKVDATMYRTVEPAEVLTRLNDSFCGVGNGTLFTMMYGVLDLRTRQLRYASGGHNPALLVRPNGEVSTLAATGTVVGVLPEAVYEQTVVDVSPQDRLLVYSDGLTDAFNGDGQQLGLERLIDFAMSAAAEPIHRLAHGLVRLVEDWSHPNGLDDDVSCLILEAV